MTLTLDPYQLSVVRTALVLLLKQSKGNTLAALKGHDKVKGSAACYASVANVCKEILDELDKT